MGGRFFLQNGMGSGGMGNLKRFLQFLKARRLHLKADSFDRAEESHDTGLHHPCYYARNSALAQTEWLTELLEGRLPERWATDASELLYMLDEVQGTTFVSTDGETHSTY